MPAVNLRSESNPLALMWMCCAKKKTAQHVPYLPSVHIIFDHIAPRHNHWGYPSPLSGGNRDPRALLPFPLFHSPPYSAQPTSKSVAASLLSSRMDWNSSSKLLGPY
jgi:hypothetical protein